MPNNLGHAAEQVLRSAFKGVLLIDAKTAAEILGVDEKTLRAAADRGDIGSVYISKKTRKYAESNLREWLERGGCRQSQERTPEAKPSIDTIS